MRQTQLWSCAGLARSRWGYLLGIQRLMELKAKFCQCVKCLNTQVALFT